MISAQENLDLLQKELTFKVRDIQSSLINDTYESSSKISLKGGRKNPDVERVESLLKNYNLNSITKAHHKILYVME